MYEEGVWEVAVRTHVPDGEVEVDGLEQDPIEPVPYLDGAVKGGGV